VVAPGRAGGSDTATQSINCCLALQHLSQYAHAVLLLDNQVMLDQLNASISRQARTTSSSATSSKSGAGRASGAGLLAAVSGRACLQGVNQLAAQALLGLLWPVGEADQLAQRTNIRQLVSCSWACCWGGWVCTPSHQIEAAASTTCAQIDMQRGHAPKIKQQM
jgi:hypothetical protein